MACGDCGDPRNLCRCVIQAADSSVTIIGTGSDSDPFQISAPGAGAGTREFDRAGIYEPYSFPLPAEYSHFDFYGSVDPQTLTAPNEFDGWYQTAPDALIGLRAVPIAAEAASGTSLTVTIPSGVRDGDTAILTVGATEGSAPVPPAGWVPITTTTGVFSGAYFRSLRRSDAVTVHTFTGLVAPFGGYLLIYGGVDPAVLDVAAVNATTGAATNTGLNVGPLTTITPGTLLLSAATIDAVSPTLVAPVGMSIVNQSHGTGPAHAVSTVQLPGAVSSGVRSWTHLPTPPNQRYSGLLLALKPATTVNYWLWIDGRWVPVTGDESTGVGGGGEGFATTIGDGSRSVFTVTHPLGLDVLVECVNIATGQTCWPVVRRTGSGTILLDFGDTTPAPQSRRVLITRVGG